MIRLQKFMIAIAFCFCFVTVNSQTDPYQNTYAANFTANTTSILTHDKLDTPKSPTLQSAFVSEAFLNPNDGFIGIVFSDKIAKPNIYYKIVDKNNREIYNGSAHSSIGSQPTLYYNTQNLPLGEYRIFIENEEFFLSTTFTK